MVWLCDQEPVRIFEKRPPPEKAKLGRWWTYLSQLRVSVHHIQGVKNESADFAFITPQGRVFKWKVMPFGVANSPALFQ